ncbi:HD-GYP domain-containing protein [Fredinandcohnia humi]
MKNYSYMGPLLAVGIPFLLFESLRNGLLYDPHLMMPNGHFYIVSIVATLSTILSIAVGIVGKRLRNIKVTILALAFISITILFMLHGLSTPHFILPETHVAGVAAQLSMLVATIWLWLSSLPTDNKVIDWLSRKHRYLLPSWGIVLGIFGLLCMLFPHVINFIPIDINPINWVVTVIILFLNLITSYRYYQTYRFTRFPLQLAIVYSAALFILSQYIMITGEKWNLSWWLYHLLLLAAMVVMIIGLVKQYAVKGSLAEGLRSLFVKDPIEQITSSASPSVKALVISTEKKDAYTAGHTFRVTMYAVKLAEELRLKPEQIRAIAHGGLVHDVGKISIPDSILNKPGKLSPNERIEIEKHPEYGYDMCRELGFMKDELSIIRFHHEKWDGSGYPDRLSKTEIPLLARIVAVADVYDALTSERSYRKAWTHNQAIEFLIEQKGIHFDPSCVDAWVNLCEREPSVYQYPSNAIKNNSTGFLLSSF